MQWRTYLTSICLVKHYKLCCSRPLCCFLASHSSCSDRYLVMQICTRAEHAAVARCSIIIPFTFYLECENIQIRRDWESLQTLIRFRWEEDILVLDYSVTGLLIIWPCGNMLWVVEYQQKLTTGCSRRWICLLLILGQGYTPECDAQSAQMRRELTKCPLRIFNCSRCPYAYRF